MGNSKKELEETPEELQVIEWVSRLMDNKFTIPGTNFKFGIDVIIGLIPTVGDVISFGISGLLILSMIRNGASKKVVARMLGNVAVDTAVGAIPIFGDLFDVVYKANRRNYKLLLEHQVEDKHKGTPWGLIIGVSFVLLLMLGALVFGLIAMMKWIF